MFERSVQAIVRTTLTLSLLATPGAVAQPKIVVFGDWPADDGNTPQDDVQPKELAQKVRDTQRSASASTFATSGCAISSAPAAPTTCRGPGGRVPVLILE